LAFALCTVAHSEMVHEVVSEDGVLQEPSHLSSAKTQIQAELQELVHSGTESMRAWSFSQRISDSKTMLLEESASASDSDEPAPVQQIKPAAAVVAAKSPANSGLKPAAAKVQAKHEAKKTLVAQAKRQAVQKQPAAAAKVAVVKNIKKRLAARHAVQKQAAAATMTAKPTAQPQPAMVAKPQHSKKAVAKQVKVQQPKTVFWMPSIHLPREEVESASRARSEELAEERAVKAAQAKRRAAALAAQHKRQAQEDRERTMSFEDWKQDLHKRTLQNPFFREAKREGMLEDTPAVHKKQPKKAPVFMFDAPVHSHNHQVNSLFKAAGMQQIVDEDDEADPISSLSFDD